MAEQTNIEWAARPATSGPKPNPPRAGDKIQARARINTQVQNGLRPHPSTLACVDCGHLGDDLRHEYDHYKGYAAEHHEDVEPVCTKCHTQRDCPKANQTHCIHGHEFTPENTGRKPNGTRFCRECRRAFDRKRKRPAGYWKAVNVRRGRSGRRDARPEVAL